jgi:hypothetical protein
LCLFTLNLFERYWAIYKNINRSICTIICTYFKTYTKWFWIILVYSICFLNNIKKFTYNTSMYKRLKKLYTKIYTQFLFLAWAKFWLQNHPQCLIWDQIIVIIHTRRNFFNHERGLKMIKNALIHFIINGFLVIPFNFQYTYIYVSKWTNKATNKNKTKRNKKLICLCANSMCKLLFIYYNVL